MSTTLYDKIWNDHLVDQQEDGTALLFVDRHLVHEVTSPQAFEGLRLAGRSVRRPDLTLAVADHNIPTTSRLEGIDSIKDETARLQVETLEKNLIDFDVPYVPLNDIRQGIVHVIGPELGFTLPGTTVVCGDSHTSTHGAFGALAFGIGTSEVEHVLATQTLIQSKFKNMNIVIEGKLSTGVNAKDLILYIINKIGTSGGTGFVIEYSGQAVSSMSMEERMTLCNMSIEAGAKAGLIAPDKKTISYLKGRELAPEGDMWIKAVHYWSSLATDANAKFDKILIFNADDVKPYVTWGTSPEDAVPINEVIPDPNKETSREKRESMKKALEYMNIEPGQKMTDIKIDKVFIGSCTNSRIEDLRQAANIIKGKKVAANVEAIVVPGSGLVKRQAEEEGLQIIFKNAGFDWREPGCSMCLGMNPDQLLPGERCASTSNRNFEGRQGRGGRTHLVSPAMAAAAAIDGHLTDVRKFQNKYE